MTSTEIRGRGAIHMKQQELQANHGNASSAVEESLQSNGPRGYGAIHTVKATPIPCTDGTLSTLLPPTFSPPPVVEKPIATSGMKTKGRGGGQVNWDFQQDIQVTNSVEKPSGPVAVRQGHDRSDYDY